MISPEFLRSEISKVFSDFKGEDPWKDPECRPSTPVLMSVIVTVTVQALEGVIC